MMTILQRTQDIETINKYSYSKFSKTAQSHLSNMSTSVSTYMSSMTSKVKSFAISAVSASKSVQS
jgi:hypothetical protein